MSSYNVDSSHWCNPLRLWLQPTHCIHVSSHNSTHIGIELVMELSHYFTNDGDDVSSPSCPWVNSPPSALQGLLI